MLTVPDPYDPNEPLCKEYRHVVAALERSGNTLNQIPPDPEKIESKIVELTLIGHKFKRISEFMDFKIVGEASPLENRHVTIHRILAGLNRDVVSECRAYFGGGTLISLDLGEYRTSNDIDFICPFGADYSKLRRLINERTPQVLLGDDSKSSYARVN